VQEIVAGTTQFQLAKNFYRLGKLAGREARALLLNFIDETADL
jgi:hypothetical protein